MVTSSIAKHPEKVRIEMMRLAGVSLDRVAEQFGVTRDAVWRHMRALSPAYRAALIADVPREELARRAVEESGSLLDHLRLCRNISERMLIEAKAVGDPDAVAKLTNSTLAANESIGKLTGELRRGGGFTINNNTVTFTDQPQWRELTAGLLDVAARHPAAKESIIRLIDRVADASPPAPPILEARANAA